MCKEKLAHELFSSLNKMKCKKTSKTTVLVEKLSQFKNLGKS
jgi:hypothetical protein